MAHYNISDQSIFLVHEGAAAPLPSRGGVPEGRGGVCISFIDAMLETPPLPLPLKGGECLRSSRLKGGEYSYAVTRSSHFTMPNMTPMEMMQTMRKTVQQIQMGHSL